MSVSLKPLDRQVIVITGASSGIGLATARDAAQRGASLVLVSRSGDVLEAVAGTIAAEGAQVLSVAADMADRKQVEHVAAEALARFGRIDTWVNNAGCTIYGRLDEVSEADSRRLFETNFWGMVYGSLEAVEHFRKRPGGGKLINVGSVLSDFSIPEQGIYVASKHAVKGFTNSLRMEMIREGAPVSVSLIKPSGIASPYKDHAPNYMDDPARIPAPLYAPEV
ncbi:MAG TPA: SDR family oxidoreductase, partial [Pseudoduganella sp.]